MTPVDGVPAGVDAALWARLNVELTRVLAESGTAKRASAAAAGKGSIVPDLGLHIAGGHTVFTWSYRQHGDYDLNGLVNAADLVQVGLHFGKTSLGSDWQKAQLADGDGNCQVSIADVAAIGQNFGGRIDGYEFQRRGSSTLPWELEWEYALLPGNPQSGQYPQYTHEDLMLLPGPGFRVVPFTDAAGPRAYGTPSLILDTKAGLSTHWYTSRGNTTRDGMVAADGPVDPSLAWELSLPGNSMAVFITEPMVDQYGNIYVGQTANPNLSSPEPSSLWAVSPAGQLQWSFRTLDGLAMPAACNRLGQVVIGDLSGVVYCLAPDGKQYWRRQLAGMCIYGGALLDDYGVVYILIHTYNGSDFTSSTLYKLEADGSVAWSRALNDLCRSSPFIGEVGQGVCCLDIAGRFYRWDADGNSVNTFMLPAAPPNGIFSGGALGHGATLCYATDDSIRVNALDNTGSVDYLLGGETPRTMPALNSLERIIIGTWQSSGSTQKLNYYAGPMQEWELDLPGDFMTNAAVDGADNMYLGTYLVSLVSTAGNGIHCVRSDQTSQWFHPTGIDMPLFCAVAGEGKLVCLAAPNGGTQVKLICLMDQ